MRGHCDRLLGGDDAVVGQHLEPQFVRKQNSLFELPPFLLQPEIDLEHRVVQQPERGQPTPQVANRPEPGEHRGPLRRARPPIERLQRRRGMTREDRQRHHEITRRLRAGEPCEPLD